MYVVPQVRVRDRAWNRTYAIPVRFKCDIFAVFRKENEGCAVQHKRLHESVRVLRLGLVLSRLTSTKLTKAFFIHVHLHSGHGDAVSRRAGGAGCKL